MAAVRKLSYVCYETPDLARQRDYYTDVLGMSLAGEEVGVAYLAHTVDHHSVVLRGGGATACIRIGLQIGAEEDLDAFERDVQAHGVQTRRARDLQPGIVDTLSFSDPKGTVVDVFRAPEPSAKGFSAKGVVPNKLGHVAFHVDDVLKITDFYCDVLGFRVSDWLERRFSFLRCNSDHHTVNFIQGDRVRHDHTAFELRDWSHLELACDYLSRSGYPLIWGPGRHGIGHNLFTYHKNPDGLVVELYAELDQMSDERLGYFDPRPWHLDIPQRPKTWALEPGLVNRWRDELPPPEMLEVDSACWLVEPTGVTPP